MKAFTEAEMAALPEPTLKTIATHEAGHAVAAIACGCVVGWAAISERGGRTEVGQLVKRGGKEDPLVNGIVAWAGSVAEGVDHIQEHDLQAILDAGFGARSIETLYQHARAILSQHRRAVRAVASALEARRELGGAQVRRIALAASPSLRHDAIPFPKRALSEMAHGLREFMCYSQQKGGDT